MSTPYFLARLGLDASAEERDIRRAYARELKQIDQEHDPAGFQHLRECYERAQSWARYREDDDDEIIVLEEEQPEPIVLQPEALQLIENSTEAASGSPAEPVLSLPPLSPEPSTPPAPRFVEPKVSDAQQVLAEFLPRFYAGAQSGTKPTLESVRESLARCLADPRMVSLDAGDEFERAIAHVLVQGWKPGHETLFVAALLQFDWEKDVRRLERLGYAGNTLVHAVAERQHFFQQEYYSMEAQRRVIEMLRKLETVRPSDADLVKYLPLVQGLTQRYPHVLDVIAGQRNAETWVQFAGEVPERVRDKTKQIRMQEQPKAKARGFQMTWGIWVMVYLTFQLLRYLLTDHH